MWFTFRRNPLLGVGWPSTLRGKWSFVVIYPFIQPIFKKDKDCFFLVGSVIGKAGFIDYICVDSVSFSLLFVGEKYLNFLMNFGWKMCRKLGNGSS